jgi:hypothetical protein
MYPLTLSVRVIDYLGQGISNTNITVEKDGTPLTFAIAGGDGTAQFSNLVGGQYRITAYINGVPYGVTGVTLDEPLPVTVKIHKIVSLGGLLIETSQFVILILALLLVLTFVVVFAYRRFRTGKVEE